MVKFMNVDTEPWKCWHRWGFPQWWHWGMHKLIWLIWLPALIPHYFTIYYPFRPAGMTFKNCFIHCTSRFSWPEVQAVRVVMAQPPSHESGVCTVSWEIKAGHRFLLLFQREHILIRNIDSLIMTDNTNWPHYWLHRVHVCLLACSV